MQVYTYRFLAPEEGTMTATHPEIETKPKTNPNRPTPGERDGRLQTVAQWLVEGKPREEALNAIQSVWLVGRRAAQAYLHDAQAMLADEAAEQEELFYLRLSQRQRDRLLETVLNYTQALNAVDPKMVRMLTALVGAACRLLDGRNRTAGQIHKMLRGSPGEPSPVRGRVPSDAAPASLNEQLDAFDQHLKQALTKAENVAHQRAVRADDLPGMPVITADQAAEESPETLRAPVAAAPEAPLEVFARIIRPEGAPDIDDVFGAERATQEEVKMLRAAGDETDDPGLDEAMLAVLAGTKRPGRRRVVRRTGPQGRPDPDNEWMRRELTCARAQARHPADEATPKMKPGKELGATGATNMRTT